VRSFASSSYVSYVYHSRVSSEEPIGLRKKLTKPDSRNRVEKPLHDLVTLCRRLPPIHLAVVYFDCHSSVIGVRTKKEAGLRFQTCNHASLVRTDNPELHGGTLP
jgi:hypothetical protein